MVSVDLSRCRALADVLRRGKIPEDREDTSLPELERARLPNFLLMVVAICHQTTPATGEAPLEGMVQGELARGWDYLLRRLAAVSRKQPQWTTAEFWSHLQAPELSSALSDDVKGDRLTDPDGRAELVRDLGRGMTDRGWQSATDMYHACGGRIQGSNPNLVEELAKFQAYRDPVRKKTYFFLSLMRNFGLWAFTDLEHLGPPADYHEVRGHLRIGTVCVADPDVRNRLLARQPVSVDEDNRIRACVVQAIESVAHELGVTPSRAHYMFWNVFRNVCTREDPQCFVLKPGNALPERYRPLTQLAMSGNGCPFSTACRSAGNAVMLQDPVVVTDFH